MHTFRTRRRVEFVDTDMGGIVHFSRFFVFMETTEHLFLEELGHSVDMELGGNRIGWPRVSVSCDYRSPARFGDVLDIELRVVRKGRSSMTYDFRFSVPDRGTLATGRVTSVCCRLEPGSPPSSVPIPAELAERIEEAPAE